MKKIIVIGASAGGVTALDRLVSDIPADLDAAVLVVLHIGKHRSRLPALLERSSRLAVRHAVDREPLLPGVVLVAPPDRHLLVARGADGVRVALSHGPKENHSRPAIDPLFRSAAEVFGDQVIGVILTGYLDDGTAGLHAIKQCGGTALVQDPLDAYASDMPRNALNNVRIDHRLPLDEIGPALIALVNEKPAAVHAPAPVPPWVRIENQFFVGQADMDDLQKIASRSRYSCPDCGGVLFQLHEQASPRFRCHTGHAYTLSVLLNLQDETIEKSIWEAVRALQEKEHLAEQLAWKAGAGDDPAATRNYTAMASRARSDAATLRALANAAQPLQ